MVHWGWLVAVFIGGAICGTCAFIGMACLIVGRINEEEEEEQEILEQYMNGAQ